MTVEVLKPPIARETAMQDRHAPKAVPIRIEIEGRSYVVSKLSDDDTAVVEFSGPAKPAQLIKSTMIVALDGFTMAMPATWSVTSFDEKQSKLELKLASTNAPEQQATINTVIRAIAAGNVLTSTEAVELATKRNQAGQIDRLNDSNTGHIAPRSRARQRRLGAVMFILLGVALLAFIVANVIDRMFVVKSDGMIVNPQSVLVRTPDTAELVSYVVAVGTRVSPDTPVAFLKTRTGQIRTVLSGCDCVIGSELVPSRAVVRKGQPIMQLVPAIGANKAVLSIPLDDLRKIRVGDKVSASFYDSGARIVGTVDRVSPPKIISGSAGRSSRMVGSVEVHFARKLPAWRVGDPVTARITLSRFNPFA